MPTAAMNPAHPTRQPRSGRSWITVFTATLAVIGMLGAQTARSADGEVSMQPAQAQSLGVQVQAVAPATEAVTTLSGKLTLPPRLQQVVAAPVDGLVTAVLVDEGDAVRAGQPLLRLRSTQLPALQREHRQAESQLAQAERNLKRDEQLLAEGLVAASRVEQSRHEAQLARLAATQQRQLVGQVVAGASVDANGELVIKASAAQQVMERMVELGQRVEGAAPLFKLARLDEMLVDVQMAPELARQVAPGRAVWVRQGEGAEVSGQVVSVGARVNEGNQGVSVRARLKPAAGSDLRPGQWVSVRLQLNARAHTVAESALVSLAQGGEGVFVEAAPGRYRLVGVRVLGRQATTVAVSGLSDGARVVVRGTAALKALLP